jgi:predicted PurR-regulated permease PerM
VSNWTGLSAAQLQQSSAAAIARVRDMLFQLPAITIAALFEALLVVFLSLYLLLAGPSLQRFVLSMVPRSRQARARRLIGHVGHAMGGYIRGAALDGLVMATLTWIALTAIGVEYAPVFAVLAGFGEFIPYIGPIVAALPAIAVALLDAPAQGLIVAAAYVGLQQIDSHLIVPNIMRTQTDVHPAMVIFAVAAGFSLGGVLGAIVAIPLFAALRVLLVFHGAPVLRRYVRHAAAARRRAPGGWRESPVTTNAAGPVRNVRTPTP